MSFFSQFNALPGLPGINQKAALKAAWQRASADCKNAGMFGPLAPAEEARRLNYAQQQMMSQAKAYKTPQAQAIQAMGPTYLDLLFSEWTEREQKQQAVKSLNDLDEVDMVKKKSPLAKEVAKMTKPVQKIIEPALDPESNLEFMLVRQAKEKLLAARKDWTAAQQNQVSVLNTQLTRLQAWNIVWTAVTDQPGESELQPWLIKRVFQVCDNVLDPSLDPLQVDSILNPKPELMAKPAPPPPANPFDREFS